MKKLSLASIAVFTSLAAAVPMANAATATSNFNVSVTLSAVCQATNSATQTLAFGNYTAFGNTHNAAPTANLTFECTRSTVPTSVALSSVTLTGADTFTPAASGATTSGTGVISGLAYSVAVAAGTLSAGAAATAPRIGTVDKYTYAITGAMAANQAGDSTNVGLTTDTLQLTVTY